MSDSVNFCILLVMTKKEPKTNAADGPRCPLTGRLVDPVTGRIRVEDLERVSGAPFPVKPGGNCARALADALRRGVAEKEREAKRAGN